MSTLESLLAAPPPSRTVVVRGRDVVVRAVSAAQYVFAGNLTPEPAPPLRRPPTGGSLAPLVPDTADPAYVAAVREKNVRTAACVVVLATDLAQVERPIPPPDAARAAVDAVMGALSIDEITELSNAAMRLADPMDAGGGVGVDHLDAPPDPEAEFAGVIVPGDLPADHPAVRSPWKLPERYSLTGTYLVLEACRVMGWTLPEMAALPVTTRQAVLAYVRIHSAERAAAAGKA